jgi:hypothetical protein
MKSIGVWYRAWLDVKSFRNFRKAGAPCLL